MTVNGESVIRFHRDRFDPARSFGHFVLHGLTETPVGPVLGFVGLLLAIGSLKDT
jgi:hypothetical protein